MEALDDCLLKLRNCIVSYWVCVCVFHLFLYGNMSGVSVIKHDRISVAINCVTVFLELRVEIKMKCFW
jgi:hypothetical protein